MNKFATGWRAWHRLSAELTQEWGRWVHHTAPDEPEWAALETILALDSLAPPATEEEWDGWQISAAELAHEVWVAHGGDPEQADYEDYWNAAEEAWWGAA